MLRHLLALILLVYTIIPVTSKQRCLKSGLLHEISSFPIKLHRSTPLNLNTRQVSLLANNTLLNFKGITTKANEFVSGKKEDVTYRLRDVEIFKGEAQLTLAAYYCAERGGKLVEVQVKNDTKYLLKVMKAINVSKIPIDLVAARGTFYRTDGTLYDHMSPDQVTNLSTYQANLPFLDSNGAIIAAVAGDLTGKIPLLCQRQLSVLRQNPGSKQAVKKFVSSLIGKIARGTEIVKYFRDLPELPSGSVTALAGKVLELVPNGRLMELFQVSKRINTKAFWENLKVADLAHFVTLLLWLKGLKASSGTTARLPLAPGDQLKDFINKRDDAVITNMTFTPSLKSSSTTDFLVAGNASFLEYSESDYLRVSTFSSFIEDDQLLLASYLVEHQQVSYITNVPITFGTCGDEPCPTSLDFTFEQASCAKYILGHALAARSHCRSVTVDYPVCYRTTCDDVNNMVCSAGETMYIDAICRNRMTQTVRLPKGTHYARSDCRLAYKGTTVLDEIEDGGYFLPPSFPNDPTQNNTLKDLLLYALTIIILGLLCCGACGFLFTRSSVVLCLQNLIRCNGFCTRETNRVQVPQGEEQVRLAGPQGQGQSDGISVKSQEQESRAQSRQDGTFAPPSSRTDLR